MTPGDGGAEPGDLSAADPRAAETRPSPDSGRWPIPSYPSNGLSPGEVRALGLGAFALLLSAAAFLPARATWVHVWSEWRVTAVVLGALALVLLTVRPWRTQVLQARNAPLLLALAGLAAGLWAAPRTGITDRTFTHLALCLVTGFLCARVVAAERSLWRPLALCVAGVAGLVALGGLVEVATGTNLLYADLGENPYSTMYREERRAISTQFNPAPLGSLLVVALPFAAWFAASRERRWRLPALIGVPVIVVTIFLTYSRGALLGLFVATGLALLLAGRPRQLLILVGLLATVVLLASWLPYPFNKFGTHGFLEGGGLNSVKRLSRFEMTAAILADHPLVGLGFQGSRDQFDAWYPPHRPSWGKGGRVLDSTYLTVFAETGLLGAGAMATFLLLVLRRGLVAWRLTRDRFVAAALVGVIGLLVTGVGYDLIYWSGPVLCLALGLGVLSGAADAALTPSLVPNNSPSHRARQVTTQAPAGP